MRSREEDDEGADKGENGKRALSRQSNRVVDGEEEQEGEREKGGEGKEEEDGTDEGCPTVYHGEHELDHNVPHRVQHR